MTENLSRPKSSEYDEYFQGYISKVGDGSIVDILESQIELVRTVLEGVPNSELNIHHAPYTWTIMQVVGHCIDTERVFEYRAARFAAGDETSLPGFDQDLFVNQTDYQAVALKDLIDEFVWLRRSSLAMFRRQFEGTWRRIGYVDGKSMSVRAAAYVMAGHINHHFDIIRNRLSSD